MVIRKTKLTRWLESIGACAAARRQFKKFTSFDVAWRHLYEGFWVWWLGMAVVELDFDWGVHAIGTSAATMPPILSR